MPSSQNTQDPDFAIEINDLCKTYALSGSSAPVKALDDVSITIPRGSFFGLLGPNGAGKSTLINILAGLVIKTSGEARIWNYDIERDMRGARLSIGVVPQELNIDPYFTPRECLEVQAGLYGVKKANRRTTEVLEAVGLADKADAYARSLSGGMRRRLLVAKAMVHSPPVLVLDEPSAGVDVNLRRQLWERVKELNNLGVTVLLTTHYLEEAQSLCDTIAIINHGRLIACEATNDMVRRLDTKEITITVDSVVEKLPDELRKYPVEILDGCQLKFSFPPSQIKSGEILSAVQNTGLSIIDVETREAELEDIFLKLTGTPVSNES